MKVLIFSFYFSPDLCAGSFRCQGLVDALKERMPEDSEIEIVTTLPNRYASYEVEAPEYEKQGNVTVQRIPLPAHQSGMLDQAIAFKTFYFKAIELTRNNKYDVVVATSSRLFTAFLGARYAAKYNVPLYLDIRDIFTDTLQDVLSKPLALCALPILRLVEKYTIKRANKINLVSPGFNDYFTEKFKNLKIENFTNGIDEVFFNSKPVSSNDVKTEQKVILYAGNIGESQGLHHIIPQLAKRLEQDNVIFKVIGDGGRKQILENAINEQQVNNVHLLAPTDRATLIQHYADADVLFCHLNDMPAFLKVLPSKIFEYAIFNKPILAGINGIASQFFSEQLGAVKVFSPCDADEALAKYREIQFESYDNRDFVERFRRKKIMAKMADSIIDLVKQA